MYCHMNSKNGEPAPLVSEALYNIVMAVRLASVLMQQPVPHVYAA